MKRNKLMLPILAVIVGIAASAFTVIPNQRDADLVWFEVKPDGSAVDPSHGIQSTTSPFGCTTGAIRCSSALSISESEVTSNGDGTYSIQSGVNLDQDKNDSANKPL